MNPAEIVITKFGGLSALARALGHKHPTTVSGWRGAKLIPARQMPHVLAAARKHGIALDAAELVSVALPAKRKRRA